MPMNLHGRSLLKEVDFTRTSSSTSSTWPTSCGRTSGPETSAGGSPGATSPSSSRRPRPAPGPRSRSAAHDQGAHVTYLGPEETQIGHKESMKDTARVLGRMFDGIEYRGFSQDNVEILAQFAGVPVWNGLTDEWHPTQMLADILTMRDHVASPRAVAYCYLG